MSLETKDLVIYNTSLYTRAIYKFDYGYQIKNIKLFDNVIFVHSILEIIFEK